MSRDDRRIEESSASPGADRLPIVAGAVKRPGEEEGRESVFLSRSRSHVPARRGRQRRLKRGDRAGVVAGGQSIEAAQRVEGCGGRAALQRLRVLAAKRAVDDLARVERGR